MSSGIFKFVQINMKQLLYNIQLLTSMRSTIHVDLSTRKSDIHCGCKVEVNVIFKGR